MDEMMEFLVIVDGGNDIFVVETEVFVEDGEYDFDEVEEKIEIYLMGSEYGTLDIYNLTKQQRVVL